MYNSHARGGNSGGKKFTHLGHGPKFPGYMLIDTITHEWAYVEPSKGVLQTRIASPKWKDSYANLEPAIHAVDQYWQNKIELRQRAMN